MLPPSLTVLVDMAAQLAWPITQALFHSFWIGVVVAVMLRLIEGLVGRSRQTFGDESRPEFAAKHRFTLSLTALGLVAASLPLSFLLVFDQVAFDEAVAGAGNARDAMSESAANLLEAKLVSQVLDDPQLMADSAIVSLAKPMTETSPTDADSNSGLQHLKAETRRFAPVIAALYGLGVLVMLLRLAVGICGGRRLASGGDRLTDSALMASLHHQATRLGVKLRPLVSTCERVAVPVVVGVVQPVILLPASLLSGLAPEDVEAILAHELAHLRRRDHLTVLIQRGLEAVLFYHPVAWWLGRRIDGLREDACDDLVLESGVDRISYASTLLRVAELRTTATAKRQQVSQLAVDGGHPSKLRRRIERIVESNPETGFRVRQSRSGLALLTACVTLAIAFLVQMPAQSQSSSPPETVDSEEDAGESSGGVAESRPASLSADESTTANEPDSVRRKLATVTEFTADEMPLLDVLDFVERESKVDVAISLGECMLRGINGQSPVTLTAKDTTFVELLSQVTRTLNLTFEITHDGIRIPARTAAFEFRIVPELPSSNASVRLPENWKENIYQVGTDGEANGEKDAGFAWFPVEITDSDLKPPPATKSRGTGQIALLSDDPQHIVTPDGRWHVQEVRLEDDSNGQKRLAVTVDQVGGAHIRKLSQVAMNQKVAMLVHGVVIMTPTVRSEIGEKFVISGGFSDEQWRLIEKSVKQAMLPDDDEFSFDCDVRDKKSEKPVVGASVRWIVRKSAFNKQEEPLFDQRFTTDEEGRFQVTMPRDAYEFAKRLTVYEVSHPDYLGKKNVGVPLRLPDAPERGLDLRHLKLTRGIEVTGRFIEPDGSPAADVPIMVSRNRQGPGSGFPGDVVGRTDSDGRFRVVTTPSWPKRLHWYPDEFVSDSKALKKTNKGSRMKFGDQGTIRLKTGPRLKGKVVDLQGLPLSGVTLYAATGTRVPIRYVTTDKVGEFKFPPLPPAEYGVGTADLYFDAVNDRHQRQNLSRTIDRTKVILPETSEPKSIVLRQVASRKLTIRAFDDNFLPKADAQFHVGLPPNRDVVSEPDPDSPGTHYLWLRNGQRRHTLRATVPAEHIPLWQTDPKGPAAPGKLMVLDRKYSEVVVRYRQAGAISLTVKVGDRVVPISDRSLDIKYKRNQRFSKVGVSSPGFRVTSVGSSSAQLIRSVAPDEEVVIEVGVNGALRKQRTVRVTAGQTTYVTIDLADADPTDPQQNSPAATTSEADAATPSEAAASDTAALTVKYDIPGSPEEARILVQHVGVPNEEIGSHQEGLSKWTPLKNGTSFDLKKLSPGNYQVARMRPLEIVVEKDAKDPKRAQRIQTVAFLDRHQFSLKSGEQKTIDLSRRTGQRVTGTVVRADDPRPARMLLYVCSPEADGVDALSSLETTIYDAQQCNDGKVTTDQLKPGEYSLLAVGYDAWPREAFFQSGLPRPGYAGRIKLKVPPSGRVMEATIPLYRIQYPTGGVTPASNGK